VLDEQFAVILMDVHMPGLDGFETFELLKLRERSRHIPIIFLSAFGEHVPRGYSAGAVDFILKPIDPDALRAKVGVFVHLRHNELALEAARNELEARVAARTAELAATNQMLEREIAERTAAERRLFDQAHHDPLTGLANRALLMEHLGAAVARSRRRASPSFAVMLLDLDRFKYVNDTLGHLAGDQLLVAIAHRLRRCLRAADLAAPLGGDEFAILLDGVADLSDATRSAQRIANAIATPFDLDGRPVHTTASIGIAMMSASYARGEDLLRDADAAMYRAKELGRARYHVFDHAMRSQVAEQLHLEADLRSAIDRHELALHYQPIIELRGRRIVGFEALLRWRHPTRGLVLPAELIPIAEETGLGHTIGRWVLDRACEQLAAWHDMNVRVDVNLTTRQFTHPSLAAELTDAIAHASVDPTRLRLEITESAMLARGNVPAHTLGQLRDLGVSLCLDDFGTGYSCLAYLTEIPVAAIKIDRSFVARIGTPNERPEVLHALVALAHNLGIEVTAQGVERADQLARLSQLECETAQGFYFAHPLEADAAEELLRGAYAIPARTPPRCSRRG